MAEDARAYNKAEIHNPESLYGIKHHQFQF